MKNSIILTELSREELTTLFVELKQEIAELRKSFQPIKPPEYLTRQQVKDMLQINMATLYNWCKAGKLSAYGIGNRVYFLRSEVEAAIKPLNGTQKKL